MDRRDLDPSGQRRTSRSVDAAVWIAIIALLVGLAGGVWWLSGLTVEFRLPADPDQGVEAGPAAEVVPPVTRPGEDGARAVPAEPVPTLGPNGEVLTQPAWVTPPDPVFPEPALRQGIEKGAVTLHCETLSSGQLGACEVVSDTAPGAGFSEAALAATRAARVRPATIDGVETDGAVRFTVRFETAETP